MREMTNSKEEIGFFGGYRVAGIMVKDNKILLQSDEYNDFWTTPGGGVKMFESSEEALKREFREELEADIIVERLLYIVENSFKFEGKLYHGLELYFLISPKNSEHIFYREEFIGTEDDFFYEKYGEFKLTFRWFPIETINKVDIKPAILKEALSSIPEHPVLFRNLEIRNNKK